MYWLLLLSQHSTPGTFLGHPLSIRDAIPRLTSSHGLQGARVGRRPKRTWQTRKRYHWGRSGALARYAKISRTASSKPGTTSTPSRTPASVKAVMSVCDLYTVTDCWRGLTTTTIFVPASSQAKIFPRLPCSRRRVRSPRPQDPALLARILRSHRLSSTLALLTKATSGARTVSGSVASLNPVSAAYTVPRWFSSTYLPGARRTSSSRARARFPQGSSAATLRGRVRTGTRRRA